MLTNTHLLTLLRMAAEAGASAAVRKLAPELAKMMGNDGGSNNSDVMMAMLLKSITDGQQRADQMSMFMMGMFNNAMQGSAAGAMGNAPGVGVPFGVPFGIPGAQPGGMPFFPGAAGIPAGAAPAGASAGASAGAPADATPADDDAGSDWVDDDDEDDE